MEESLFMDRVRDLFAMLDRMVYWLISVFYNTINDLATVQVINSTQINAITGKVYALLGVFMLFKISFSLINYLVDPDQVADKAKGGGALIKNIMITFVLIVSVPFGFNLLYEAQSAILSDQIIPELIFATDLNGSKSNSEYTINMDSSNCGEIRTTNMGNYIGLAIFKPFFYIETENAKPLDGTMKDWYCQAGSIDGGEPSVTNMLKKSDLYNAPKGWSTNYNYTMNYSFFLSTAIGVVVALLFLSFCFDIAVRALKLLFLEMIAPIPIISFIDPNSAKNGMFKKWGKQVLSTWASLFIRLASVFLAIYVIQQITAEDGSLYFLSGYNFGGNMLWLKLLLIIGALIFAKELPKILEEILGLKLSGSMSLNPFKKIGDNALGGKALIATGAGVAGAVGGGIAGFRAGAQAGAPGRGTAIGMINGFNNGKGDPKKAFSSGMNKTYKSLTGNEMSTMTPSRMMMGIGGKGTSKVDQMKGHLNTARNRLYSAQSQLNAASYRSSRNAEQLQQMGQNPREIKTDELNLKSLENSFNASKESYNRVKESLQIAQSNFNANPSSSQAKADLETIQKSYNDISSKYELSRASYEYASAISEEEKLRGQIGKIEKEISTLSDEKKQRETFWQVDTSPKTSVKEAMDKNPIQK